MIPVLYKPDESNFDTDGIGSLTDALTCTVTEERNGPYELEMTYPVGGQLYDSIKNQCVIKAKPNDKANLQLFRVYKVTKPINQICTVYAEHISYELAGNPVLDFNCSGNAAVVLQELLGKAVFAHKFTAASDITGSNTVKFAGPHNVREIMGGTDGSVLDTFGGEYEWDDYTVTLHAHRGRDNGVTVEYGKNLTDLTQEETIDSTYTCVVPYAKTSSDGVDTYHYWSGKYVNAPNADKFARPKALMVDFSDKFKSDGDSQPVISEAGLKNCAEQYIKSNNVGVPKVSLTIKYVPLWMLPEYAGNPLLERVSLCDTVTVRFERLGVDAKARVNKIAYNVLQERVEEAELGDTKSNFVDSYAKLEQKIENVPKDVKSIVSGEVGTATSLLTGAKGGHVVIKTDANKKPQEILIMDTEDSSTAVNVWRWNVNGFGHSGSGINGPYDTAITIDGKIIGKFIYALSIYGSQVTAGAIKSVDGNVVFDLDGNQLLIYDKSTKQKRLTVDENGLTTLNEQGQVEMCAWNRAIDFFEDASNAHLGWFGWAGSKETNSIWEGWGFNADHCTKASICYDTDSVPDWTSLVEFKRDGMHLCTPLLTDGYNVMLNRAETARLYADEAGSANIMASQNFGVGIGNKWVADFRLDKITFDSTVSSNGGDFYGAVNMHCNTLDMAGNYGALINGYTNGILRLAGGSYVALVAGGSDIAYFNSSGLNMNGHSIVGQSDRRLKKNIKHPEVDPLEALKQVEFVQYDWRKGNCHVDVGVIAQQLEQVAPELVETDKDGYKCINQTQLLHYALMAIQQLAAKVDELEGVKK